MENKFFERVYLLRNRLVEESDQYPSIKKSYGLSKWKWIFGFGQIEDLV